MKCYKLNLGRHFKAFKVALFQMVAALLFMFLLVHFGNYDLDLARKLIGFLALIIVLPASYLHYCYYLANKDFFIEAKSGALDIYDWKNNLIIALTRENVTFIEIYASANHIKMGVPGTLPHEGYHYAIIKTDEKDIIITSLLYPDILHLPFKFMESKCSYHKTFFASI